MRSMGIAVAAALALGAGLDVAGCAAAANLAGEAKVYGGTRIAVDALLGGGDCKTEALLPLLVADLPATFALDTATLPITGGIALAIEIDRSRLDRASRRPAPAAAAAPPDPEPEPAREPALY